MEAHSGPMFVVALNSEQNIYKSYLFLGGVGICDAQRIVYISTQTCLTNQQI